MKKMIAAFSLSILTACASTPQSDPHTTVVSAQRATLSQTQINQAVQAVGAKLRDPSSAQFGSILGAVLTYADGSTRLAACGLVNAKNAYGAYVGNDMYLAMYDDSIGAVAIMDAELVCRQYRIV